VKVGTTCVDKYEASVWQIPADNTALIAAVSAGEVTLADLTTGGATQHGATADDYGTACPDTGNGCTTLYAASVSGAVPSSILTWFQAAATCRNAGKRLLTNEEWQAAAFGTPDGAPCNVSGGSASATGTAGCVSDVGAFDLVGNLDEWVSDWVPRSTTCGTWSDGSGDYQCLAGAATSGEPGALLRGGTFQSGTSGGPLSVNADFGPSNSNTIIGIGFRCAR